mmetsp:Transcript_90270/g.233017  ORF Transcript_90270/g.233017 Transcript_90270/m.233017 type:complete len:294 (+) Transcript_90270:794-1675(+)
MFCSGRPASSTALSRSRCSIQRARSLVWPVTAVSSSSSSISSQAQFSRKTKAIVEAHSQKSGSGSKVALANGCISRPMRRPVELHAFAAMTSRSSSSARRTARGFASSRRLWRMHVPSCASNCTSSGGASAPSIAPAMSLVSLNSFTIRSMRCRPADASEASSQLEACAASAARVSRWLTRRDSGALFSPDVSPGSSVWKCVASVGSACSRSSCTHLTANAFVALRGTRYGSSDERSFWGCETVIASASSSPPPSSSSFLALGGGAEPTALGGRASTIRFSVWSHIGSCNRPR